MPTLEFDELPARIGLPNNWTEFGDFSGSFDCDDDGRVECIRLDASTTGRNEPIVLTPRMPGDNEMSAFWRMMFVALANSLEYHYRHAINDALPVGGDQYAEHRMSQREFI